MPSTDSLASSGRLGRRSFLRYVGGGASSLAAVHLLGPLARAADVRTPARDSSANGAAPATPAKPAARWVKQDGTPDWTPVDYPLPSPGDGGSAATDRKRFETYPVRDELMLPKGFRYDIVAIWGDTFGKDKNTIRFGYAADYTGLSKIPGTDDEYWLIVNHEYISGRPWLQGFEAVHGKSPVDAKGNVGGIALLGLELDFADRAAVADLPPEAVSGLRRICAAGLSDLGVSILRVKRKPDGTFAVVKDAADHLRITGLPTDNTAIAMRFTGPAARMLGRPGGTFGNCSGATTPWGTFLTCEENFQDQVSEFITPAGKPLPALRQTFKGLGDKHPTNLPFEFEGLGTGIEKPLDGRQYGWVCEVDPVKRTLRKHTSLGRFRHENVALRVEKDKPLAAYMGDDRRGGHVWKFVSKAKVKDPTDPANAKLLEDGTLYVARLNANFTGSWIPLVPSTPLRRPEPATCALGHVWLPRRGADDARSGGHVAVGAEGATEREMFADEWMRCAEAWSGKAFGDMTLGDLVDSRVPDRQAVIVADAYAMANAAGGTPCARPEDLEVHPRDGSVYIAFTDSTGSGDGSPDVRIFPDSAGVTSRQYGAVYRIAEKDNDPAAESFEWGKFVAAGEAAEHGGGFACADNLAFDPEANVWLVTDITTPAHNSPVSRTKDDKSRPGEKNFVGVFGNNALFMLPTTGDRAGVPHCFAIGPMESELTGPTFTDDGRTLLLSVQHPGELHGTHGAGNGVADQEERRMLLRTRDGKDKFTQARTVPLGSNFPPPKFGVPPVKGQVPKPCVLCITRET